MLAIANARIGDLGRWGPLYVVDVEGGVVRKFAFFSNVTGEANPDLSPINIWVEEVPVENDVAVNVQHAGTLARKADDFVIVNPGVPNMPEDAHDALGRSSLDIHISDYIQSMTTHRFHNELADWLDIIPPNQFFDPSKLSANVELIYQDGSRALYKYDTNHDRFFVVPNTSRDSNGNLIPEKREDVDRGGVQYYDFTRASPERNFDDYNDMVNRLGHLGVPISIIGGPVGGSGEKYSMICAGDICTVYVHR
jgi:hypothetical protein